jgi:hypothetical protein
MYHAAHQPALATDEWLRFGCPIVIPVDYIISRSDHCANVFAALVRDVWLEPRQHVIVGLAEITCIPLEQHGKPNLSRAQSSIRCLKGIHELWCVCVCVCVLATYQVLLWIYLHTLLAVVLSCARQSCSQIIGRQVHHRRRAATNQNEQSATASQTASHTRCRAYLLCCERVNKIRGSNGTVLNSNRRSSASKWRTFVQGRGLFPAICKPMVPE